MFVDLYGTAPWYSVKFSRVELDNNRCGGGGGGYFRKGLKTLSAKEMISICISSNYLKWFPM